MSKPAARITDMHVCPMQTPGTPPIPHVGGPIIGPGSPTVLIGNMPAAVLGDSCVCVGPPDSIVMGSSGVLIGGKPAARMGDTCAHGGTIVAGCPTVLIGEAGGGGGGASGGAAKALQVSIKDLAEATKSTLAQIRTMTEAADEGKPLVHNPSSCNSCPDH